MSLSLTKENLGPYAYNKVFFETGTFTGGGVEIARLCGFEKIISIEADERLYKGVVEHYKNMPNIKLYWGDSELLLPKLIKGIDEPITFWLDSHLNTTRIGLAQLSTINTTKQGEY